MGFVWGPMRLICPNCTAQYEVDDNVIPDAGRDVQCSACGHTWFQPGADAVAETAAGGASEWLPGPQEWGADISDTPPENAAQASDVAADDGEGDAKGDTDDDDASDDGETAESDATRRMLDESLLAILREEAERETRARRAEGHVVETQPDLGLEQLPAALAARAAAVLPPAEPAPERGARLRPDPTDTSAASGARRDRLPDIEVINSTLRPTSERGSATASRDAPEARARRRSGFRAGFLSVILLAAVAAALYVFAPNIGTRLPVLDPALEVYVAKLDVGRLWLDAQMRALTEQLRDKN